MMEARTSVAMRKGSKDLFDTITLEGGTAFVISPAVRQRAFARFVQTTREDWVRMAARILRSWKAPAEVELDDVVQVLHMGVWEHMCRFDPSRGTRFDDYLVFNAYSRAKKWVHKARGAVLHGNPDSHKSRIPLHLEDVFPTEQNAVPSTLTTDASQEELVDAARTEDRVMRKLRTVREFHAFTAYRDANGRLDLAVEYLMEDPHVRRETKIWSDDQARSVIINTVKRAAQA